MAEPAADLDALAAQLPAGYQGHWIAEVVRAFAAARGLDGCDLLDYWQEAVMRAGAKLEEARSENSDPVAYVKRGVRNCLIDLNRRLDVRRQTVALLEGAEADDDDEVPGIEDSDRSAFASREEVDLKRLDDVRVALYATTASSPALAAYWRAYAATNGTDIQVGARLGCHRKTVAKARKAFLRRFRANYEDVRFIRGRAA